MKRIFAFSALAVVVAVTGGFFFSPEAQADTPTVIQVAIPTNVTITVGSHEIIFIGRPTSISSVACASGTPQVQTAIVVERAGGTAAEVSGVLAFHDHEIAYGSRYEITGGPNVCNTDFKLYTATLIE